MNAAVRCAGSLSEDRATCIAGDWNVKASGVGYLTRFEVKNLLPGSSRVLQADGHTILEYWIPAGELDEFNANILGNIELVAENR
jgi:hypothetical protein